MHNFKGKKRTKKGKEGEMKITAKRVALIACFAPWYTVTSMWKIFPVIGGASGTFIDGSSFISPLFGLVLGPEIGFLAVAVGGLMNLSMGSVGIFGPFSFLPHAAAAFCAGMLLRGKRAFCTATYLTMFLFFAFFPVIGPFWLWPQMLWLQVIALFVLISPLQSKAIEWLSKVESPERLTAGVCVTAFTSVLFGHVVGCIIFEVMYWQSINQLIWQLLTFQYAFERIIMTLGATAICVPLIKALNSCGLSFREN